ncbi:GTPase-associated system all-helical protein GASH [Paraburkholderia sediminicola]|uniref:GTPase-associated system all-helical protein GASH n=1 Tax=Paraburkholderia sediminicola TaxID=458836 RepID=UPI0038B753BD
MSNMAEYARIFDTGTSDEWVEKRKSAVAEAKGVYEGLKPQAAISTASIIAASIADGSPLPEAISNGAERVIQNHASSFVRSADQGELQIKVVMLAAAIDVVNDAPETHGWTTADALAAAFWSALWFQRPLEQTKVEKLRQDVLVACRNRVLRIADFARKRRGIPPIGPVSIDQDSAPGTKVNQAFMRAVEPMVSAMRDNAALDREELDFMWWLLSDRSETLDEPLADMPDAVRAVVAGLDAAAKLRRLPTNAHRNIVLRNVTDGDPLSLIELLDTLGDRRAKLALSLGARMGDASAVFPLITAIASGDISAPFADEKLTASEWGARALLEGAIHHMNAGTAGGL